MARRGIYYYNARYYDPTAGKSTSADSVPDGLNRYAYVAGNPATNLIRAGGNRGRLIRAECGPF